MFAGVEDVVARLDVVEVTGEWRVVGPAGTATVTGDVTPGRPGGRAWVKARDGEGHVLFDERMPLADAVSVAVCAARPADATDDDWAVVACHDSGSVRRAALCDDAPEEVRAAAAMAGVPDAPSRTPPPWREAEVPWDTIMFGSVFAVIVSLLVVVCFGVALRGSATGPSTVVVSVHPAGWVAAGAIAVGWVLLWRSEVTQDLRAVSPPAVVTRRWWAAAAVPLVVMGVVSAGSAATFASARWNPGTASYALADRHGWDVLREAGVSPGGGTALVDADGELCEVEFRWRDGVWQASGPCVPDA